MLKCPYCIETRPSRSRLQDHVDNVHRHAEDQLARRRAVAGARTVEDVVADLDVPALCICGEQIEQVDADDDDPTWWTHVRPGVTPCMDAVPVKRTLAAQGRKALSEKLADTGTRLDKAAQEIRDLKAKADAVARRLEALDAGIMQPAVVRRATLNQAWDKLIDAGDIVGAQVIMRMISSLPEGDWS